MRGPFFPSSPNRRRAVAFALTLVIEALFLLAFLVPFRTEQRKTEPALTTISLRPAEKAAASRKATAAKAKSAAKAAPSKPQPPQPIDTTKPAPPYIQMSREDFAAGDISKIPSSKGEGETGKDTAGSSYGPGEGPNGAPLYKAAWYGRPPGNAELALYLKKPITTSGWAQIICQTAPNYRVENCRSRGESPLGSGVSSALRQAAWQFKVIPPRLGGKPLIGVWVSIHYEVTVRQESAVP